MGVECFRCRHETPSGAAFCPSCGARLPPACVACGASNPLDARFCARCGERLPNLSAPSRFPAPGAYTPDHLARRILTGRTALEGERKQVTILFADLRGSLEALAGRDPEDARRLLDPVLDLLMEAVHRYEGTVNQVMGDGIMALFGAPLALEDHALRACYAALSMQDAVQRYARSGQCDAAVAPQIRVGINAGEVVVRSIGSDLRMDYTAVGQATHLAARMEQMAPPGSSWLTGAAARLVSGCVDLNAVGPRSVKGLPEPVEVFELLRARPLQSRFETVAARGLSRFVGRDVELAALRRTLDQAAAGRGQVVALVGESGVGKSRLCWEVTRPARVAGWQVIETGALAHGSRTAYLPVAQLLRSFFDLAPEDDTQRVHEKVADAMRLRDMPPELLAPLLALLDVPVDDRAWQALDAEQRRRRIVAAFRHLLLRESARQPLCVVVEDLHWLDAESQAVLDDLVEGLAMSRLCVIVSYRPEYRHGWDRKTYYSRLRVEPLGASGAHELLDALLGSDSSLAALRRLLMERTEGNPFFLEESVRHLAETGVLSGALGSYRLARKDAGSPLPATVHAVLAARIDRLPAERKALLEIAAVIGKDVPVALLEAVAGLAPEDLRHELGELQAAEFLYELRLFPEHVYTFKHPVTVEVGYSSLLREQRRALHESIMAAIERLHADRLAEHVEPLSHHALHGEVWDKALAYCREAGLRALERSAARSAVAAFERSLAVLERLPLEDRREQAIDLRLDLRAALSPLGESAAMIRYLEEAETLARALAEPRRLGLVSAFLANYFTLHGQPERASECARRALEIAGAAGDRVVAVLANAAVATLRYSLGEYAAAAELAQRNLQLLTGAAAYDRFGMGPLPAVYSRGMLAWSLAELGRFADAQQHAQQALRIAEAIDHPHSVIFACQGLGGVHLRRGDAETAMAVLERGLALCEAADIPAPLMQLAGPLASSYALAGRGADALRLVERAVQQAIATENAYGHLLRSGHRAEAYLALGRPEEALALARRYVEMTRFIQARGLHAWGNRLLAEACARLEGPARQEAGPAYRRALALAEELGMRPLAAQCRFGLGLAERAAGNEHLLAAQAMFRELDMPRWAERVDAELARPMPLAL